MILLCTVFDRKVLQEMCSVLPEDKQGPVLEDIRKISKERRRQRDGTVRVISAPAVGLTAATAVDGLTGVYRSTSELSCCTVTAAAAAAGEHGSGDHPPSCPTAGAGSLMATVRAARRKQSMSATTVVYNPAFYDAPVSYASPDERSATAANNPAGQPYLRMTPENGFSLHPVWRSAADASDTPAVDPVTQL